MKISNIVGRVGKEVANQFIIEKEDGVYFQSYKSMVAFRRNDGSVILDPIYWDFSRTTKRHLGKFLGDEPKELNDKVKKGIYKLANLN